ncbi:MAG: hypothetical protein MUP85_06100 [Candidatus Lokiarchaeota archaeon]|nr:hypothetical protein [Candidatus Lokiarchaeota archaeon]
MTTNDNEFLVKTSKNFECKICNYITSRKYNIEIHNDSIKHKNNILTTFDNVCLAKTSKIYSCVNCSKYFNDRAGLWRHKKKCINISHSEINDLKSHDKQEELIEYLLKENSEFKQLMLEHNKHMLELANNSIKNAGNNNNNSFNLNFFLNETCKNAMNIMDFVSQIQVGIKELEDTGRLGFAEGISKIFINGLKQIDISDRPIHCTDVKRETMYIKDKDAWLKDSDEKTMLTNAVKHVANKNMKQISEWAKEHPEYNDSRSKQNDVYLQIVSESMSGSTQEETNKNYTKIIKNIAKESLVDK